MLDGVGWIATAVFTISYFSKDPAKLETALDPVCRRSLLDYVRGDDPFQACHCS